MAGDVKAEHRVLTGEAFLLGPRSGIAQFEVDFRLGGAAAEKQAVLAGLFGAGGALNGGDGVVHGSDHGFAGTERVQSAALYEAFEDALVEETGLDAFAEFEEGLEFALAE